MNKPEARRRVIIFSGEGPRRGGHVTAEHSGRRIGHRRRRRRHHLGGGARPEGANILVKPDRSEVIIVLQVEKIGRDSILLAVVNIRVWIIRGCVKLCPSADVIQWIFTPHVDITRSVQLLFKGAHVRLEAGVVVLYGGVQPVLGAAAWRGWEREPEPRRPRQQRAEALRRRSRRGGGAGSGDVGHGGGGGGLFGRGEVELGPGAVQDDGGAVVGPGGFLRGGEGAEPTARAAAGFTDLGDPLAPAPLADAAVPELGVVRSAAGPGPLSVGDGAGGSSGGGGGVLVVWGGGIVVVFRVWWCRTAHGEWLFGEKL
ncbi:hypothetical protein STAS_28276 [Striga asiatica]|uniref:Uncharacterized protein n=1 Tax=Striga asiatica TaxID=4170 RepID=A0A5A7QZS3_STRAF|nr:hypothetical protein STAS_28276 [Striga asiatica]